MVAQGCVEKNGSRNSPWNKTWSMLMAKLGDVRAVSIKGDDKETLIVLCPSFLATQITSGHRIIEW